MGYDRFGFPKTTWQELMRYRWDDLSVPYPYPVPPKPKPLSVEDRLQKLEDRCRELELQLMHDPDEE